MKDEIKQEWTTALRSGDYQRGRRKLHTVDAEGNIFWCCLGVLCDIAVKHGVAVRRQLAGLDGNGRVVMAYQGVESIHRNDNDTTLPVGVAAWAEVGNAANPSVGNLAWLEAHGVVMGESWPIYRSFSRPSSDFRVSLAEINDYTDLTFPKIADLIDASEVL